MGFVFISWDEFLRGTPATYYSGSQTLLHEVLHFLGLYHTFQKPMTYNAPKCTDGDYVDDTPTVSTVLNYSLNWRMARLLLLAPKTGKRGANGVTQAGIGLYTARERAHS
ncbi:hypothetical protein VOLCADRAFT_87841 [Volvox carteri f. nagariensis]|uniref:Peptidase M43 pregnancy-associated plasma-A domain-containing protein n=1 Tax=Volvox carteri f. nagariensis TaxID=3068 RepID=D8TMD9_VOLCA|nr:uncharacterized protein VOLCADRAFT_87841 [Volvox carteri f. nagariensis]EFJ51487.1 hypothetical protein VOLCADRAFT_87841 [Volvox carteri f. nagariensis]|eukprot:XP_002947439.1 hypothetical protein VOLCADRAFT_87841 [Volvox carteri f. nagariensis]